MLNHKFTVHGKQINVAHGNIIGMLAILQVGSSPNSSVTNPRVSAIKFLRSQTGLGLLEAKLIVDVLHDKGATLDREGEPKMPYPTKPDATYDGTED